MTPEPPAPSAPQPVPPAPAKPVSPARRTLYDNDGPPEKFDVGMLHAPIIREKLEPRDGYEPVPLWLVAMFGALVFWGGWYLATYSGGFRGDMLDENPEARYSAAGSAVPAAVDPVVLGERLYRAAGCVSCHQGDGAGQSGQTPPLAGSEWINGEPARIKRIVLHGLSDPVTVAGRTFNGNMPPFGAKLKDEQIAAILTYVRTNGTWGNSASPITAESVAATRAATKDRVLPWTAGELLAITQDELPAAAPATSAATQPSTAKPR